MVQRARSSSTSTSLATTSVPQRASPTTCSAAACAMPPSLPPAPNAGQGSKKGNRQPTCAAKDHLAPRLHRCGDESKQLTAGTVKGTQQQQQPPHVHRPEPVLVTPLEPPFAIGARPATSVCPNRFLQLCKFFFSLFFFLCYFLFSPSFWRSLA